LDFLNTEDHETILDSQGKIKVSLYKILLFTYTAKGIKSGTLSMLYSYKYRSFDDYLIPLEYWNANKKELLSRAGLEHFSDFKKLETKLRENMNKQLEKTNISIENGSNKNASVDAHGKIKVNTPAKEIIFKEGMKEFLPNNRFISIYEILSTVNSLTNFSDDFTHLQPKNIKKRPEDHMLFAGIIGYGCNIGHRRLGEDLSQYQCRPVS